jgi:ribosomal protein L1
VEEAAELMSQQTDALGFESLAYGCNINLNLEALSKRPSHKLRGVFDLPHGTGRTVPVLALHNGEDYDLTVACLMAGASFAGNLCDAITSNKILPVDYTVLIATTDMREETNRRGVRLAKLLKRHNLTPSEEMKTLVEPENLVEAVKKYANGNYARFKAAQDGNVPCCLGKLSVHTPEQIKENLYEVLRHLFAIQPSDFGTGRFAHRKNRNKYVLGMHIHAKGIGSYPLDMAKVLTDLFQYRMRMIQIQGDAFWKDKGKNEPRDYRRKPQKWANGEANGKMDYTNGAAMQDDEQYPEVSGPTMVWDSSTQTWIENDESKVKQQMTTGEKQYGDDDDDDEDLSWLSSDSEDETQMNDGDEDEDEDDHGSPDDEDESDFHDDEESDDDVFDEDDDDEDSGDGTSMDESSGSESDNESFK